MENQIEKDHKIHNFLVLIFFEFLANKNLLIQWIVNLSLFAINPEDKKLGIFKVLKKYPSDDWINLFLWGNCEKDLPLSNTQLYMTNLTWEAHDFWSHVDAEWKDHQIKEIINSILKAYLLNPNNSKLPTETHIEAIHDLIDSFKNCDSFYRPYGWDTDFSSTPIHTYLSWGRSIQGSIYWARIHNAICESHDKRFTYHIWEEDFGADE